MANDGFRTSSFESAQIGVRRVTSRSAVPRPKEATSPYYGSATTGWEGVTRALCAAHPLSPDTLVGCVQGAWHAIFQSRFGSNFKIGQHIFPKPQIIGFLLHELIPLYLERANPGEWRAERTVADKDIVCIGDDSYSIEVKTSANENRIFANRSYGQEGSSLAKKAKSGYYLAVNFQPWPEIEIKPTPAQVMPEIVLIRFGWLDHGDWIAQTAATGQAASLPAAVENSQLLTLYRR